MPAPLGKTPTKKMPNIQVFGLGDSNATRAALRLTGTRWAELATLWDVDTADDLARWRAPGARAA